MKRVNTKKPNKYYYLLGFLIFYNLKVSYNNKNEFDIKKDSVNYNLKGTSIDSYKIIKNIRIYCCII